MARRRARLSSALGAFVAASSYISRSSSIPSDIIAPSPVATRAVLPLRGHFPGVPLAAQGLQVRRPARLARLRDLLVNGLAVGGEPLLAEDPHGDRELRRAHLA